MTIALLFLFGVGLLIAPEALGAFGHSLGVAPTVAAYIFGGGSVFASGALSFMERFYVKTKASEAFVRTGAGGVTVIQDGGSIVLPFWHQLIPVSLKTLKLTVNRDNEAALITLDKLRADIHAEFFVRVEAEAEAILQASRSLGEKMGDPEAVGALVEDKLVSALRTAAASKTLEQLNSERDEFLTQVTNLLRADLQQNGLILETATISRLDQTDERFLKEENIFDAQGRRKIAEITQLNLTERNRLVRAGEQERKAQDVVARKRVLELEQAEREASARQVAEVAKIEAETVREAREKSIEAERHVQLAEIEKQRALEVANREQQREVEIAERQKQERIAEAERLRAAAQRALADAEADRELAQQRVETVRVTEAANRAKEKQVIESQATAETSFVLAQRHADAEAYKLQKQADAQKAAADAAAEAVRKRAAAEAEAEQLRAEGEKAKSMVPVQVQRAQVDVDRDRIETVVKPELEAREKHGKVAQDFEIAKLRIAAEQAVRVAMAEASSRLFEKLEAKLYGTPEDASRILDSVVRGQSVAKTLGGFFEAADPRTLGGLNALTSTVGAALGKGAQTFADSISRDGDSESESDEGGEVEDVEAA